MKSRKLRAVLAALSAVAVLATAMTGFAATVTTTTEYVARGTNAHVVSVVSGANGDVTYLAKTSKDNGVNSSGILYIDQKYTSGEDITFDYYVNKSVIDGAITTLALGTNGTESIDDAGKTLEIYSTADVDANGYTITYAEDYYGNSDGSVTAVIEAKFGYEITGVTIDNEVQELGVATYTVPVKKDGSLAVVAVATKEVYSTSSVIASAPIVEDDGCKVTTIFKLIGNVEEVGVTYNSTEYPAAFGIADTFESDYFVAVQLKDSTALDLAAYGVYSK